jgi:hypothetical protein
MAKKFMTVQVYLVSWFPMYAEQAAVISCISRESANSIAQQLKSSFEAYPAYDPLIHIDRSEARVER